MGGGGRKRHFKGNTRADDKRVRREREEEWKSAAPQQGSGNSSNGGDNAAGESGETGGNGRGGWTTEFGNDKFESFYKAQGFVAEGADWTSFMEHLRSPLPACFRLNPNYPFVDSLVQELQGFVDTAAQAAAAAEDASSEASARKPTMSKLAWVPSGMAYQLGTDRRSIRRTAGLEALHQWMIRHTENGNITRQEAVSMVPPLALDVAPHHRCLDMCAAPGSKTSQLLEVVARSWGDAASTGADRGQADEPQQGIVVANDADTDRAYMLVHQCRRSYSPLLVITTHKGQMFPSIRPSADPADRRACFFDRVLCDVPCSGDGTLRKSPHIWPKWTTNSGVDLHPLQLMIARRGFELLKPGGLMVYSTCSMSPYENESVVAELLRSHKGEMEIVDARQFIPLMKCREGMSSWFVLDDSKVGRAGAADASASGSAETTEAAAATTATTTAATEDSSLPEAVRDCVSKGFRLFRSVADVPDSHNMRKRYRQSLFPPSPEEAEWMHLERCLRCVPQDENTGGFFVTTLRKIDTKATQPTTAIATPTTASAPVATGEAIASAAEAGTVTSAPTTSNGSGKGLSDFLVWGEESFNRVSSYYGLEGLNAGCFFIREDFTQGPGHKKPQQQSQQPKEGVAQSRSVYYFPPPVRAFLNGDVDGRLKCVSAGVKVFERKNKHLHGEIEYRLVQEGADFMCAHMPGRVVRVDAQEMCNLLGGGLVSYHTLSANTVQALSALTPGSIICEYVYSPEDVVAAAAQPDAQTKAPTPSGGDSRRCVFRVVCHKGFSRTVNVMCSKVDVQSLRHQLEALGVYRPKINAPKPTGAATASGEPSNEAEAAVGGEEVEAEEECCGNEDAGAVAVTAEDEQ